jgi:hypothetical protein
MAAAKELEECPRSAGTGGHQEMAELTRCQRKDHKVHGSKNMMAEVKEVLEEEDKEAKNERLYQVIKLLI